MYGGFYPGLLTTALCAFYNIAFWNPVSRPIDWFVVSIFSICGILVSFLASAMHRAQTRALEAEEKAKYSKERKRAEEALRISQATLDAFFDASPGILNIEDDQFRYIKTDRTTPTYFGLDTETIVGKAISDLAPEFMRDHGPMMRRVIETGLPELNVEVKSPVESRPGEIAYWLASYFPVPLPDGKRGIGIMGVEITERKKVEEALRESEEFSRRVIESSLDCIKVLDLEGNLLSMSTGGQQLLEVDDISAYLNTSWIDLWQEPDRPKVASAIQVACAGGKGQFRAFCPTAKGNSKWWDVVITPILDFHGNPEKLLSVSRDITERKRVEENLKAKTAELEAVLNQTPHMFTRYSRDLTFRFASRAYADMLALSSEQIAGRPIVEVIGENGWRTIRPYVEAVLQGQRVEFEAEITYRDSKPYRLQVIYVPERNERGEVIGWVASLVDVTEGKKANEKIRELTQRLNYHIENSPLAVIEWGPDMRLIRWAGAAERIFGWNADEVLGKRQEDFRWVYVEDEAHVAEVSADLMSGRNPNRFSLNRNYRKDGSIISCEWYNSSLIDESGKLRSILSLVLDVTKRKETEEELLKSHNELDLRVRKRTAELEKANKELRQIPSRLMAAQEEERKRVASELHDSIGQTLAAMKFRLEHIIATLQNFQSQDALQMAQEFVPILQRSIEETRTIYMGLRPKALEDFGVIAALRWYREQLLKLYPERHIEAEFDVEENEVPRDLHVPIFRIAQEALNNVCKHSRAEWADLTLSKNGTGIELIVSDDGVGMDVAQILQSSMARSLGLTGMRERAEITGGSFTIESVPGEGTTVRVCWPDIRRKERIESAGAIIR